MNIRAYIWDMNNAQNKATMTTIATFHTRPAAARNFKRISGDCTELLSIQYYIRFGHYEANGYKVTATYDGLNERDVYTITKKG